jgi:hypothetical protein
MARSQAPEEISRQEGAGSWRLWFAVLGAPLAWITHLAVSYSLEEWFACAPSTSERGQILGLDVRSMALIITAALALVALAAGFVAFSCLRKISAAGEIGNPRPRWMAIAGIMNSILYLFIIVVGVAPPLILNTCQRSP